MKNPLEKGREREFRLSLDGPRKAAIRLLAALTAIAAQAQEFSVPWFSIDGGGGFSGGGEYELFGTVGQSDAAAPSTGGGYTLTAGFVPGLGVQNEAPILNIAVISPGQVTLAWEAMGGDYVLQQSDALDAGAWTDIPAGGISPVVLTALESGKFYRLRRR
jgi:hypothetical protein